MISYSVEPFKDVVEELGELLHAHWKELAWFQDRVPLAPRWDTYAESDDKGDLIIIIARDEGKVVGYFVGFLNLSLHYGDTLMCVMDILYVTPKYRNDSTGYRLFSLGEKAAKDKGAQFMVCGTKVGEQDISAIFKHKGFEHFEAHYTKWIGD